MFSSQEGTGKSTFTPCDEWVERNLAEWLEHFANHVTEDPMGDYFKFREGARNFVEWREANGRGR